MKCVVLQYAKRTGQIYFYSSSRASLRKYNVRCRVLCLQQDFEYGMQEFAMYDNNGYLLQFGAQISNKE